MAKELTSHGIIYSSNINERIFIKSRVAHENLNPKAIVFGSSRIMQASSEGVGLDLLNLSVSGASLEDLIAIWELSSRKFHPEYVFVGADPWIFNANSGQSRWKSLQVEYNSALAKLGLISEIAPSVSASSSKLDSVAVKFYKSINQSDVRADDDSPSLFDKIRRDGSRVYNVNFANKSVAEIERGAPSYVHYGMSSYQHSNESRVILERFLRELAQNNRKVVLVLSPYHPLTYQLIQQEARDIIENESIFREIASSHDIKLIGSYNPEEVGCLVGEFYDGMHPKDECIRKVFAELD